jgi:hypothetical protein
MVMKEIPADLLFDKAYIALLIRVNINDGLDHRFINSNHTLADTLYNGY